MNWLGYVILGASLATNVFLLLQILVIKSSLPFV